LGSGETRDLGSFANLKDSIPDELHTEVRSIMIEIVGHYGSEDLLAGGIREHQSNCNLLNVASSVSI
jgi:hypothetical protein